MPFDSLEFDIHGPATTGLQKLEHLMHLLRDEPNWPKTFLGWDYSDPATCAIGMTYHEFRVGAPVYRLDIREEIEIFRALVDHNGGCRGVTPLQVSNKIEEVLRRHHHVFRGYTPRVAA